MSLSKKFKFLPECSVKEILKDKVIYTTKGEEKTLVEQEIPSNFVLWSTGIAMNPFTRRVSSLLPNQVHFKAIEVDAHLRVKGAPLGTVYAIGDSSVVSCSRIFLFMIEYLPSDKLESNIVSHLLDLVDSADRNHDGKIDLEEWKIMGKLVLYLDDPAGNVTFRSCTDQEADAYG